MGIETAAILGGAAAAGGTAAAAGTGAAALGATALGSAAAGAGAAGAAGLGAAAGTAAGAAGALGSGAALAGGTAGALGSGSAIAAGSLEAANLVGAVGGDALGAFISANQGFGTMTAMESAAGFMSALGESPVFSGIKDATKAANSQQQAEPAKKSTAPVAYDVNRPNQNPGLTQSTLGPSQNAGTASLDALGFENGGIVPDLTSLFPDNIFARTRQAREEQAGLTQQPTGQSPNITINVGQPQGQEPVRQPPRTPAQDIDILQMLRQLTGYQNGGQIRTGSSDVKAGGEIRGPQSASGKDNQLIKVAGGEGILPVDVMEVEGVPELVQSLIKAFHKPI